jgi:hypothetical protein
MEIDLLEEPPIVQPLKNFPASTISDIISRNCA